MAHLELAHLDGYSGEPVTLRAPIESTHEPGDIQSAQIRITDQTAVVGTIEAPAAGDADGVGYVVTADVTLPTVTKGALYSVSVEVTDTADNGPIPVAIAQLTVKARVPVSA